MVADKARLLAPLEEASEFIMSWLEHAPSLRRASLCLKRYLVTIM